MGICILWDSDVAGGEGDTAQQTEWFTAGTGLYLNVIYLFGGKMDVRRRNWLAFGNILSYVLFAQRDLLVRIKERVKGTLLIFTLILRRFKLLVTRQEN